MSETKIFLRISFHGVFGETSGLDINILVFFTNAHGFWKIRWSDLPLSKISNCSHILERKLKKPPPKFISGAMPYQLVTYHPLHSLREQDVHRKNMRKLPLAKHTRPSFHLVSRQTSNTKYIVSYHHMS